MFLHAAFVFNYDSDNLLVFQNFSKNIYKIL